ncbi:MAG: aldo/keto reductase [Pseudomonadota bacterium]
MKTLILGTANIGLAYGTAVARALPDEAQALSLLNAAEVAGFEGLDTAAAYGLSECRIGRYFETHRQSALGVHTKLSPTLSRADEVPGALQTARQQLQQPPSQILLHRWTQKFADDGALWNSLRGARDAGQCERIGVSVQSPAEALQALKEPHVDVIQLAYNLLDWRYETPEMRAALHASTARIEVRSVFLQGLLTLGPQVRWPTLCEEYDPSVLHNHVAHHADLLTGGDPIDLCLRFVASLDWVNALVVGADTPQQVAALAQTLAKGPLPDDAIEALRSERPAVPEALLDPSQWL